MTQPYPQVTPNPGQTAPEAQPAPMQIQPQIVASPQIMPSPAPMPSPSPQPSQAQPPMPSPAPGGAPPMPGRTQPMQSQPYGGQPQPMPSQPQPGHPPATHGQMTSPNPAMSSPYQAPVVEPIEDGGERALPNISIQAFCERSETASVIHDMSRDWRMKRTNLKIFMGGLPAATEYYRQEGTPRLVIVETGIRGEQLFAQLDELASVCDEGTQVVIIGASNDIKLYRQLMSKGVSDYLVPPFHPLNFIRSISDLFSDPEKPFVGRVVAFFGAKGGVGSSTLAHNIAWCMSEQIGQETSLIDLDASWGTTGLDFAYDATEGLEEALAEPDRLDETLLDRIMLRHTPKLSILPASCSLATRPNMSTEAYETVVNEVRSISPMTILDMPHHWCDWTTSVLSGADDVVITAAPDLANLRNAKNLVDFLKAERPNDGPPILILNKTGVSKTNEISVKDFGAAVGIDPALVIGFDPETFIEAANDGKMLTDIKAAASTVQGMMYIAERLKTGEFAMAPEPKGALAMIAKKGKSTGEKTSLFAKLKKK